METNKTPGEIIGMLISLIGVGMCVFGAFSKDKTMAGIGGGVALLGRVVGSVFK